jgi:hypothetical protein
MIEFLRTKGGIFSHTQDPSLRQDDTKGEFLTLIGGYADARSK